MSLQRIVIDTDLSAAQFKSQCDLAPGQLPALQNLTNYLESLAGGNQMANLAIKVGAVQASATITSTGTAANNETMKLAGQTLTAKSSGADPALGQFNVSATAATQAANIAAAINAMPELSGIVTASAALGVVTVTAVVPGVIGNGLQCEDVNLANVAVSSMSGGSDGTAYSLNFE